MNEGFSNDSDAAAQNAFTVNDLIATTLLRENTMLRTTSFFRTTIIGFSLLAAGAAVPAFAHSSAQSADGPREGARQEARRGEDRHQEIRSHDAKERAQHSRDRSERSGHADRSRKGDR